jgi:hypothetical protein
MTSRFPASATVFISHVDQTSNYTFLMDRIQIYCMIVLGPTSHTYDPLLRDSDLQLATAPLFHFSLFANATHDRVWGIPKVSREDPSQSDSDRYTRVLKKRNPISVYRIRAAMLYVVLG